MSAHNLPNRRHRHKHTPVRFAGGAVQIPSSPPHQHAVLEQPPQEHPKSEMEIVESGTDPEQFDEFLDVSLSDLRGYLECQICLGIIKNTRTVMGCLHRFCKECIDKHIRMGNNECPTCKEHCASRRSLRDDVVFDSIISAVYSDVKICENKRQSKVGKARKIGASSTSRMTHRRRRAYSRRGRLSTKFDDPIENQEENVDAPTYDQPKLSKKNYWRYEDVSPIQIPFVVLDEEDEEDNRNSAKPTTENKGCSSSHVNLAWGGASGRSHGRQGG